MGSDDRQSISVSRDSYRRISEYARKHSLKIGEVVAFVVERALVREARR